MGSDGADLRFGALRPQVAIRFWARRGKQPAVRIPMLQAWSDSTDFDYLDPRQGSRKRKETYMTIPVQTAVATAVVLASMACLTGCRGRARASGDRGPSTEPARTTLTGTLQSGVAAIGGETTGWRVIGDGATGGFDVDVSNVQARAKALDGKRVTITGPMSTRNWPERGPTQVLIAETIVPAAPPRAK